MIGYSHRKKLLNKKLLGQISIGLALFFAIESAWSGA